MEEKVLFQERKLKLCQDELYYHEKGFMDNVNEMDREQREVEESLQLVEKRRMDYERLLPLRNAEIRGLLEEKRVLSASTARKREDSENKHPNVKVFTDVEALSQSEVVNGILSHGIKLAKGRAQEARDKSFACSNFALESIRKGQDEQKAENKKLEEEVRELNETILVEDKLMR